MLVRQGLMSQTEEELGSRKKALPPVLEESRSMLGIWPRLRVCKGVGKVRVGLS